MVSTDHQRRGFIMVGGMNHVIHDAIAFGFIEDRISCDACVAKLAAESFAY
jgi:hypothetical protein